MKKGTKLTGLIVITIGYFVVVYKIGCKIGELIGAVLFE